jgi:hypothetical protein
LGWNFTIREAKKGAAFREDRTMSIMDKMMDKMISKMSPEEKESMMLKMMPMMMKDVDMADVMVRMMPEMLKSISVLDIFNILKSALPNLRKLIKSIKENMPQTTKDKAHKIAMEMMPLMCGKVMPTMMEGLTMDNVMPNMMKEMMPHALSHLLPKMPSDMRADFVSRMTRVLEEQGSAGTSGEKPLST